MSNKTHQKQLERARQKRRQERRIGRKQRLIRYMVIAIIVAMVASLGIGALSSREPEAPDIADPAASPSVDATASEPEDPMAAVPARDSLEPCPTGQPPDDAGTFVGPFDEPEQVLDEGVDYRATIRTTCGDIVVDLFEDDAPLAVNNMAFLASQDYYAGVPFHRTIWGFMIQGGDPTGTGSGVDQETGQRYPGYTFEDELDTVAQHGVGRGMLAMANAGPNTNGSQFFIIQGDASHLGTHTVFGEVIQGMDVVDRIAATEAGPNGALAPDAFTWILGLEVTTA
ncbi:MAG TPA: peptidylprolyl isomerase [Nitriliruptorales bacterium]